MTRRTAQEETPRANEGSISENLRGTSNVNHSISSTTDIVVIYTDPIDIDVARRIDIARRAAGMSMLKLSAEAHLDIETITGALDHSEAFTTAQVVRIAHVLRVPFRLFFEGVAN
jgi:ribosome-binding protein aMBF1 (putative translation factor)